ncbi:MAG: hypothetical protein U9N40_07835 [Euryarchaeota archaeon]|nr:hypothetical protein [Euryarchaeota archaeon]
MVLQVLWYDRLYRNTPPDNPLTSTCVKKDMVAGGQKGMSVYNRESKITAGYNLTEQTIVFRLRNQEKL